MTTTAARPGTTVLSPADTRSLWWMGGTVVLLHLVGFGLLLGVVAPQHLRLGGDHAALTVGVGLLAYTFGLRHAFDADHIAAVDNTTRKLLAEHRAGGNPGRAPRRPLSVGFWFSLGHSTIVFALTFLLMLGVKTVARSVADGGSTLHTVTGLLGPSISGLFLSLLGLVNLVGLVGLLRVRRHLRDGGRSEEELERWLGSRGLLNRVLGRALRIVREPWHIYPVGVLFGLGFDTASEVALLVLAGGAAVVSLPFYAVLVLPVLFAAGMCLMDTLDGVFMNVAYGWAFDRPVRKVFYNLVVTSISVAVALVIGGIELVGVFADRLDITTGPLAAVAGIPMDLVGYGTVLLFAVAWVLALAIWKAFRIEERWTADLLADTST
ncbi:Nickel transporter NicT [Cellulomonas alba]|uniref:Nickel/cobalt efflux system n=1 Tax=Cellulomonas alba TaxID=3053467 RepID=A0ABT7SK65_9CELL|nr:HoxN/HupN/NixA family nickel/cobalt transporter [Cellulomonas alba]MDM7856414.1 HoxN/HupN/NixA family nickel/cobalt transporter [Cellulomonas alba]